VLAVGRYLGCARRAIVAAKRSTWQFTFVTASYSLGCLPKPQAVT
jgi:hypothetical protein